MWCFGVRWYLHVAGVSPKYQNACTVMRPGSLHTFSHVVCSEPGRLFLAVSPFGMQASSRSLYLQLSNTTMNVKTERSPPLLQPQTSLNLPISLRAENQIEFSSGVSHDESGHHWRILPRRSDASCCGPIDARLRYEGVSHRMGTALDSL